MGYYSAIYSQQILIGPKPQTRAGLDNLFWIGSLLALGGSIAALNFSRFFLPKCWTQPTLFNYGLGSAFSSASLMISLVFFSICSILWLVIFCTVVQISDWGSLSSTSS